MSRESFDALAKRKAELKKTIDEAQAEMGKVDELLKAFIEVGGSKDTSDGKYHINRSWVEPSIVVDNDKVKAVSDWIEKFSKVKAGYERFTLKVNK